MADKIEALAKECGATFYTHRSSPHAPAVAFGPDAWASFCARALAQGEPGEAPDGRLHADGYFTWNTGKRPNYRADLKLPCDFYLSPTASAPAAERPPYCGSGHCSCIECPYAAPVTIKGGNE